MILNITKAGTEPMIYPGCMAEDFGRKAISVVKLISIIHDISLTD